MRKTIFTLVAIMVVMFVSCGGGGSNDPVSNPDPEPVEPPKVQSIEISPKNVTLHLGSYLGNNEVQFLKANVYPPEAEHKFVWWCYGGLVNWTKLGNDRDSLSLVGWDVTGEEIVILEETVSGLKDTCHVTVTDDTVAIEKIYFEKEMVELYEGQGCYLYTTFYPYYAKGNLEWKSEDTDIASCSDNFVSADKPGVTNIVVSTNGGQVTAKCQLTVRCITNIKLEKSEIELYEGQTESLNIAVLPENSTGKNIVWKSENEDIATVSPAWSWIDVKGGRSGETNIVGTSYDGKVVVKCHVTVKNNNTIDYHPFGDDEQW